MPTDQRSSVVTWLALAALVAAALGLRLRGLDFGLPHVTYRDGMVLYTQVKEMRTGDVSLRDAEFWGYYPQVTARVATLFPDDSFEPQTRALDLEATLARHSRSWIVARRASVLLSLLAVLGSYWVARCFMGTRPALFAAALTATSLLHVSFSQQEKPHGPVSGTVALAVAAALLLRRRPSAWTWAVATLAAALAACTLQSGAFALGSAGVVVVALLVGRGRSTEERRADRRLVAFGVVATLVVLAAAVRFFYPFHFIERHVEVDHGPDKSLDLAGHPVFLSGFDFTGGATVLSTLWHYDPTLLLLMSLGLGMVVFDRFRKGVASPPERRLDLLVVLGFVAPYLLVLCAYNAKVVFERFTMPLLPFYAVFAAWAGARLVARVPSRTARVGLACAALAFPAAAAWKLTAVRAAPDASSQVAHWIRDNVQPGERIHAFPYVDLPLFYDDEAMRVSGGGADNLYWRTLQKQIPDALKLGPRFFLVQPGTQRETRAEYGDDVYRRLVELGVRYVVITGATEKMGSEIWQRLERDLEHNAECVFRAVPVGDGSAGRGQVNIRYSQRFDAVPLFVHIFSAHCMGNTLEVYRLPTG